MLDHGRNLRVWDFGPTHLALLDVKLIMAQIIQVWQNYVLPAKICQAQRFMEVKFTSMNLWAWHQTNPDDFCRKHQTCPFLPPSRINSCTYVTQGATKQDDILTTLNIFPFGYILCTLALVDWKIYTAVPFPSFSSLCGQILHKYCKHKYMKCSWCCFLK